jgi:hypothetical protein
MSEDKNIEKLLREMGELELPKGYDERFHAKLDRIDQPWGSHFINWIVKPAGIGWMASAASVLLVTLAVFRQRHDESGEDLAMIDDEIDMLDDLEILEHWNEEEQV